MPNHCENHLTVEGTPYDVRKFARDHYRVPDDWDGNLGERKTTLDFSFSVPYPENFLDRQRLKQSSHSGWYDYHNQHWGTKWNAYDIHPDNFPEVINNCEDGRLTYSFSTAWSPPMEWLSTASRKYPDLTFTLGYVEYGCDFAGKSVFEDGIPVEEDYFQPHDLLGTDDPSDDEWDALHQEVLEKISA